MSPRPSLLPLIAAVLLAAPPPVRADNATRECYEAATAPKLTAAFEPLEFNNVRSDDNETVFGYSLVLLRRGSFCDGFLRIHSDASPDVALLKGLQCDQARNVRFQTTERYNFAADDSGPFPFNADFVGKLDGLHLKGTLYLKEKGEKQTIDLVTPSPSSITAESAWEELGKIKSVEACLRRKAAPAKQAKERSLAALSAEALHRLCGRTGKTPGGLLEMLRSKNEEIQSELPTLFAQAVTGGKAGPCLTKAFLGPKAPARSADVQVLERLLEKPLASDEAFRKAFFGFLTGTAPPCGAKKKRAACDRYQSLIRYMVDVYEDALKRRPAKDDS